MRGLRFARCGNRGDIHIAAWRTSRLRGIGKAIAACPHIVIRLGQIGQHIAPLIVGHDDFDVTNIEIICLCNHPDTGFGSIGSAYDATNIVRIDRNGIATAAGHAVAFHASLRGIPNAATYKDCPADKI